MKKTVFLLFALFLLQNVVVAQETNDVVATVNGQNITKKYVNKILKEDFDKLPENQRTDENVKLLVNKIVNQKIEDILLIDAAKKSKS